MRLHAEQVEAWIDGVLRQPGPAPTWPGSGSGRSAAQYGWSLWGSIQAASSPLDFDFHAWGMERFEKAAATFRGPDFAALLEDVAA